MNTNRPSREELFALIWDKPTTKVAQELGISDVALGKLCRRLQVPKPHRGYWARVASGIEPKKPSLPAYREELEKQIDRKSISTIAARLSNLQMDFLKYALDELSRNDVDTKECIFASDGIRSISPELAAQILIIIQNHYKKWLGERTTPARFNGALSSLSNLVSKLQPLAKEQLLIFHRKEDDKHTKSYSPTISVRATHDFLGHVAYLARISRENGLSYVTVDISAVNHPWSINYISSPNSYSGVKTELCVSSNEIWIRAHFEDHWTHDWFETIHLQLRNICSVELLPQNEIRLPSSINQSRTKPYAERLQALKEARLIYESLLDASFDMEKSIPNERLALFDKLLFSKNSNGPFFEARLAWRKLENDLERWDQELENEMISLCQDVLGIVIGDIVILESGKNLVRLKVEELRIFPSHEQILFGIWGTRFRKDGLLGKRTEYFSIVVKNDLVE